jgi:hypothetical protein
VTSAQATDKALSQARAGHVTGGRVFGYDNVAIDGAHRQRSHVERRVNESEAAIHGDRPGGQTLAAPCQDRLYYGGRRPAGLPMGLR